MDTQLELTFQGGHRVTVACQSDSASFLKLAAEAKLSLTGAEDYDDYYRLDKPSQPM